MHPDNMPTEENEGEELCVICLLPIEGSGTVGTYLSKLRSLGLIEGRNPFRAHANLFPV